METKSYCIKNTFSSKEGGIEMPSVLLLAPIQLLQMNAKLTAALLPPCFLLHPIALSLRFIQNPWESREYHLCKKLQWNFFIYSVYSLWLLQPYCFIPEVWLPFPAGRLLLTREGWAESCVSSCCDTACSYWSQAPLAKVHGHALTVVSMFPSSPGSSLISPDLALGQDLHILLSGPPSFREPLLPFRDPSLGTSSFFWKPSFQFLQSK